MRDGNEDESCGSSGGEEANLFERASPLLLERNSFHSSDRRERDRDQREIEMPTPRPPLEKRDGEQNLGRAN